MSLGPVDVKALTDHERSSLNCAMARRTAALESWGTAGGRTMLRLRRGFTIVEMLVCLAVSLLLLGIALPVLSSGRSNASRNRCVRQLANHLIVLGSYAADFKDAWPYPFAKDRQPPQFPGAGAPPVG